MSIFDLTGLRKRIERVCGRCGGTKVSERQVSYMTKTYPLYWVEPQELYRKALLRQGRR